MKKVSLLGSATVTSVLVATAIAAPAFACTPVGGIVKEVQDQTTGSVVEDANNISSALTVNSGDTLVYTITIKNSGTPESNGDDDMSNVALTDTLPTGIQLVSDPSQTTISESLGTVKAGSSVTKTYAVKVTDTTNGDIITNKACYTGKSLNNDDNQSGCDVAIVKVNVPTPPSTTTTTPTTPTTPVTPTQVSTPVTLPDTGSTALSAISFVGIAGIIGYGVNTLRLKFSRNV